MRKISSIPYFCTIKAWWIAIHYVPTIGKFFFLIITINNYCYEKIYASNACATRVFG